MTNMVISNNKYVAPALRSMLFKQAQGLPGQPGPWANPVMAAVPGSTQNILNTSTAPQRPPQPQPRPAPRRAPAQHAWNPYPRPYVDSPATPHPNTQLPQVSVPRRVTDTAPASNFRSRLRGHKRYAPSAPIAGYPNYGAVRPQLTVQGLQDEEARRATQTWDPWRQQTTQPQQRAVGEKPPHLRGRLLDQDNYGAFYSDDPSLPEYNRHVAAADPATLDWVESLGIAGGSREVMARELAERQHRALSEAGGLGLGYWAGNIGDALRHGRFGQALEGLGSNPILRNAAKYDYIAKSLMGSEGMVHPSAAAYTLDDARAKQWIDKSRSLVHAHETGRITQPQLMTGLREIQQAMQYEHGGHVEATSRARTELDRNPYRDPDATRLPAARPMTYAQKRQSVLGSTGSV